MPDTLTMSVPVKTESTTTEAVSMQVKDFSCDLGDATTEPAVSVTLSAKDGDGNWRTDVTPVTVHHVGVEAVALQQALFDAKGALVAIKAQVEADS